MKNLSESTIFEKMNPLIKEGMSNEQKRETKRLISCALPKVTQKLINLNFNFWFLKKGLIRQLEIEGPRYSRFKVLKGRVEMGWERERRERISFF